MHNIHTHTSTYIHQKTSNTYKIQDIWIDILPVSCMYFVCMTLLNVEYIHHTCTYMQNTGMCNLIYTAYRNSCICMYRIVSALYLFSAFVSACIYLLVYSCTCMYVMIFACIYMYEPNICLWIR